MHATTALIALGGNQGDVRATMGGALQRLDDMPGLRVRAVSSLYGTEPVGGPEQPRFLNAAAALDCAISAHHLLDRLLATEHAFGRERIEHWGPRTLDLDLLLLGSRVIHDPPRLILPHPRIAERRFVLVPLAEIAPDAIEPVSGRSVAELLAALPAHDDDVTLMARDWSAFPHADPGRPRPAA